MLKELDNYDWENAFGEGEAFILKPKAVIGDEDVSLLRVKRDSVSKIIKMVLGQRDEESWTGIFKLKDGRFISVCSWCDYSGWDCRAGGEIFVSKTRDGIVKYGLSEDERKRLGVDKCLTR